MFDLVLENGNLIMMNENTIICPHTKLFYTKHIVPSLVKIEQSITDKKVVEYSREKILNFK